MNLFYTTDIQGDEAFLQEEEARHCTQVLRMRVGDSIHFVDGQGNFYEGQIAGIAKKTCTIQIEQRRAEPGRPFGVHIAIAPTKNIDRFEWFLEKATEIGIDAITPLLCAHSERRQLRPDRLEKVLVAAMKQSLKANLPVLHPLTTFENFVTQATDYKKVIAWLSTPPQPLLQLICAPGEKVLVLIGPEGDFSTKEIERALEYDFAGASLGDSRLRTETAGIVACHTLHLLNA